MLDVISLSKYVIKLFGDSHSSITNLKLQKVLYYIQGYFMKKYGSEAFAEDIYCWQYGPVVPLAYYEFNHNGARPLVSNITHANISWQQEQLIKEIVLKCKDIPSSRLVNMTHQEAPWRNAQIGEVISKESIKRYFNLNNPLGIK